MHKDLKCVFARVHGWKIYSHELFPDNFILQFFTFSVCIQIQHCLFGFILEYDAELC